MSSSNPQDGIFPEKSPNCEESGAKECNSKKHEESESSPPMEPYFAGSRYKRLTTSPLFLPYLKGSQKRGWIPGNVNEMIAVFEARRQYLAANPPQQTFWEVEHDTRSLWRVLHDFPGLSEFVLEVADIRRKSLDLRMILDYTRQNLNELAEQIKDGEIEVSEVQARLREKDSELERALKKMEEVDKDRINERQAKRAYKDALEELQRARFPAHRESKSHYSINEIAALQDLKANTISTYIREMRDEDKNLPKEQQRIKTPRYKPLTEEGYGYLRAHIAKKNERLGARSSD